MSISVPENVGGRVIVSRGEILKIADYDRFGLLMMQYINDGVLGPLFGDADLNPTNGFFGDSFKVSKINDSLISMGPGIGFLMAADAADDEPAYRMVHQSETFEIAVATPSVGTNARIDLVIIRPAESQTSEYRDMKNLDVSPTTITPQSVPVMARPSWDHEVYYVLGVEAETPVAPDVPEGFTAVAQVTKASSAEYGAVTVEDLRLQLKRQVDKRQHIKLLNGDDIQAFASFLEVMVYNASNGSYSASAITHGTFAVGKLPLGLPVGAELVRVTAYGGLDLSTAELSLAIRVQDATSAELLPGTGIGTLSITGETGAVLTREWTGSYVVPASTLLSMEVAMDNDGMSEAVKFIFIEVEYYE